MRRYRDSQGRRKLSCPNWTRNSLVGLVCTHEEEAHYMSGASRPCAHGGCFCGGGAAQVRKDIGEEGLRWIRKMAEVEESDPPIPADQRWMLAAAAGTYDLYPQQAPTQLAVRKKLAVSKKPMGAKKPKGVKKPKVKKSARSKSVRKKKTLPKVQRVATAVRKQATRAKKTTPGKKRAVATSRKTLTRKKKSVRKKSVTAKKRTR